jgi:hypothetical protein
VCFLLKKYTFLEILKQYLLLFNTNKTMKNQTKTNKLTTFADVTIDKKQMKKVQGGGFWDWLGGAGVSSTGKIA